MFQPSVCGVCKKRPAVATRYRSGGRLCIHDHIMVMCEGHYRTQGFTRLDAILKWEWKMWARKHRKAAITVRTVARIALWVSIGIIIRTILEAIGVL